MCKECKPQKAYIFHKTHPQTIDLQKVVNYHDCPCDEVYVVLCKFLRKIRSEKNSFRYVGGMI